MPRKQVLPERHHIVLVPGFGGFDALGSLSYYYGVPQILVGSGQKGGIEITVHSFPNEPTAGVATRARSLRAWISERFRNGTFGDRDSLHLVAHSTGGLDTRQLMLDLQDPEICRLEGPISRRIVERTRSIQFLSTPHRGTNLARWANDWHLPYRALIRGFYEGLRIMRQAGAHGLGRALRTVVPRSESQDWIDAAIDTLYDCYRPGQGYDAAVSRAVYFSTLSWLSSIAGDFSAVKDLDPTDRGSKCPAHRTESEILEEAAFFTRNYIRVRSIATVARPLDDAKPTDLFAFLHRTIAHDPPERLQRVFRVPDLVTGAERVIGPSDNDGVVNTVSMEWPVNGSNLLLDADHGDITGHYTSLRLYEEPGAGPAPRVSGPSLVADGHPGVALEDGSSGAEPAGTPGSGRYDLLLSAPGLDCTRFRKVWSGIREFAVATA